MEGLNVQWDELPSNGFARVEVKDHFGQLGVGLIAGTVDVLFDGLDGRARERIGHRDENTAFLRAIRLRQRRQTETEGEQ